MTYKPKLPDWFSHHQKIVFELLLLNPGGFVPSHEFCLHLYNEEVIGPAKMFLYSSGVLPNFKLYDIVCLWK